VTLPNLSPDRPKSLRTAVVLFNLGGPDGQDSVQPFLQNLFDDPAIIRAPAPIRWLLARFISRTRARSARANYARMGGGSPLLPETRRQAVALEAELRRRGHDARVFVAMRYWRPFAVDTVAEVAAYKPQRVLLLPLYPQYSTTTTASSFLSWDKASVRALDGVQGSSRICCYPTDPRFIQAHANRILSAWRDAGEPANIRLLLSAHGLPETVIRDGDPYQSQVELTAAALRPLLPADWEVEICYQSRVGPLKWIGPATDEAIERAARDGKAILLSPIAFVSEHIETLVELDIEYRHLAEAAGARTYIRAPALGTEPEFIGALADLAERSLVDPDAFPPDRSCALDGARLCALKQDCPNRRHPGVEPAPAVGLSQTTDTPP
jgi:protoporphyrin/coproporphyrin ferrochelatase